MDVGKKVTDLRRLYLIRITLMGTDPAIWRRLAVTSDTTLGKLHQIILAVMGWSGTHQHRFSIGGKYYGILTPEHHPGMQSEQEVRLFHVAPHEEKRFVYEYDPGDYWRHEILVESIISLEQNQRYPVCLDGQRACPPENIGGIFRYFEFLEVLDNEAHPAHSDMIQWVGAEFDPEVFNKEEANARLARVA